MAKEKYEITDEEYAEILKINKEGGDPLMYLSGGIPMGRSLQEKINDYWKGLALKKGFREGTIEPIDNRNFYAEPKAGE
jgi:hypothetical protein